MVSAVSTGAAAKEYRPHVQHVCTQPVNVVTVVAFHALDLGGGQADFHEHFNQIVHG
jgi:hypothetical protein